jgi:hypothetical protein
MREGCFLIVAALLAHPLYWALYIARELWRSTWQR